MYINNILKSVLCLQFYSGLFSYPEKSCYSLHTCCEFSQIISALNLTYDLIHHKNNFLRNLRQVTAEPRVHISFT